MVNTFVSAKSVGSFLNEKSWSPAEMVVFEIWDCKTCFRRRAATDTTSRRQSDACVALKDEPDSSKRIPKNASTVKNEQNPLASSARKRRRPRAHVCRRRRRRRLPTATSAAKEKIKLQNGSKKHDRIERGRTQHVTRSWPSARN